MKKLLVGGVISSKTLKSNVAGNTSFSAKQISTTLLLSLLFSLLPQVVKAWEPVIKEKHWFGMHEYYRYTDPTFNANDYLSNIDFSSLSGWTTNNSGYNQTGNGNIGYSITLGSEANGDLRTFTSTTDTYHKATEYCFGIEARWENSQAQISQQTSTNLTEGTYRLTYDVQNVNSETQSNTYDNLFYVQIDGGATVTDNSTEWMGAGSSGWTTHTIEFSILSTEQGGTGPAKVTISMGYGLPSGTNIGHVLTPALFVSQMKLIKITGAPIDSKTITWSSETNSNNGPFLESIEVKKGWTGQTPLQAPKTTYYSWLDRQLRFSVNRSECWDIDNNGSGSYEGVGLYNKSDDATCFWIHHLKAGDQFNIEYYREPRTSAAPFLVSGSVNGLTPADSYSGSNAIYGTNYYTMSSDGDVSINIPSHTLIRSVTIIHANYQKATATVTPYEGTPGYTYRLTGPGVLEDKRGAVPYITMRFGAENDMTFVRNLGNPGDGNTYYGASCIIDESNNFDPDGAKLQAPYHVFTAAQVKDRLAGKEWSVFTASQTQSVGTNDYQMNNGYNGSTGDWFNTIYPLYGSYYYFFPEVKGQLIMEFYCEGSDETPAFWYKKKADGTYPGTGEQPTVTKTSASGPLNGDDGARTNGSNFYRFTVDVEKDGVYYLCSLPTNIAHEHPVIRLISYTFIPEFRVEPLYKVVANGTQTATNAATIYGGTATVGEISSDPTDSRYDTMEENKEQIPLVKCVGNIKSAVAEITNGGSDTQYLTIKDITFKDGTNVNEGGAVVVHINCAAGEAAFVLTVAYDAANKNPDGTAVSTQVKKWDFYDGGEGTDGILAIGKYNGYTAKYPDTNWFQASQLYKEVNKADGLTADWVDTYVNIMETNEAKKERIFKSVYDMAGDNADMLHETAGLVFFTNANMMGIYNENDLPTSAFKDRYIGLMKGGRFTIPLLDAGDRIVMKMGTYGNLSSASETTTLRFTNLYDATGQTEITGNYVIGGSAPVTGDVKDADNHYVPRGEYHFVAKAAGDATVEVTDGQLLKLYTIEIYRNAKNSNEDIITENEVLGDPDDDNKYYILNTQGANTNDDVLLHAHYNGLNEPFGYHAEEAKTGNLTNADLDVRSSNKNDNWYDYGLTTQPTTPATAKFGVFKAKIGVKTIGQYDTYVTDYAYSMVPVGYRETKTYPYTWDFTDLKKYVATGTTEAPNGIDASGNERIVTDTDLKVWNEYGLRTNSDEYDGYIFAPGGQLYGGTTMFDETGGIGIIHNEAANKSMTINGNANGEEGGLDVSEEFSFVIPKVAAGQAIYVHATPGTNAEWPTYSIGNGDRQTLPQLNGYAFGMKMADNASTADVTLHFKGCEVNKIAVSGYSKTVNKLGYATESRDVETDPELMGYMTGTGLKAYTVASVDYGTKAGDIPTITLQAVPSTNVIGAATNHDHNAYIIYNTDAAVTPEGATEGTKAVNAVGGGFHLFVPDMHDMSTATGAKKTALSVSGNGLRSWMPANPKTDVMSQTYAYTETEGVVTATGGSEGEKEYTTYVLSSKGTNIATGKSETGVERFRRVAANVVAGNNKAYLPLLTAKVKPSTGTGAGAKSMFAIVFVDEEQGTETTSLNGVESTVRTYNDDCYYTLSGMKVSQPLQGSIYVKNGKKVVLK